MNFSRLLLCCLTAFMLTSSALSAVTDCTRREANEAECTCLSTLWSDNHYKCSRLDPFNNIQRVFIEPPQLIDHVVGSGDALLRKSGFY